MLVSTMPLGAPRRGQLLGYVYASPLVVSPPWVCFAVYNTNWCEIDVVLGQLTPRLQGGCPDNRVSLAETLSVPSSRPHPLLLAVSAGRLLPQLFLFSAVRPELHNVKLVCPPVPVSTRFLPLAPRSVARRVDGGREWISWAHTR